MQNSSHAECGDSENDSGSGILNPDPAPSTDIRFPHSLWPVVLHSIPALPLR
jgi:hypothetical protein